MVQIKAFEVEEWMDRLETTPGALNIAETCCESVSIKELTELSSDKSAAEKTRQQIANLYENDISGSLPNDQVIITQGAIVANFLTLYTLVGANDHVICVHPTYQQLYEVPKSLGAEVSLWKLSQ
ncbi:hypothetical protein BDP81DRAFT_400571 [Colletotrichum phormii]|uniref:Aminotransferase class I/classII domain-containing protein n=1 Tax=Colletotrichum phormii TaxID=359342 RepID=A0AAI9ZCP7_9PEZI|nr:uncharacterized protein BDP81DRAFT_400571 [Colletotrichum phormii]KAK1622073.1 hypothetical protein BDP81DRAFT_400571 [Colletotrichum phormii]